MRAFLLMLLALPLFAITANDVLQKMPPKEQSAYIAGAVDMAAQENAPERACIVAWYYNKDGAAQRDIAAAFAQYPDKQAVSVIKALIKRQCQPQQ